ADSALSTRMKSVGEVMAIGRTFAEALGKAYRALERDFDLGPDAPPEGRQACACLEDVAAPSERRLILVERALAHGHTVDDVAAASAIDPWFVDQVAMVSEHAAAVRDRDLDSWT